MERLSGDYGIKLPRLVAIDSSILASWAHDAFSVDAELRAAACTTQTDLLRANWIPIICLHHFIELARHSDLKVGASRLDFLKSFPQIAWLGRSYDPTLLGSIVDVFEAEVATIVAVPNISFSDIRDSVRAKLLRYSPPADIKVLNDWVWLHPTLEGMARYEQEVASVIHAHQSDLDDMKISKLKKIRINRATINGPASAEIEKLEQNLRIRGDSRLTDTNRIAQTFLGKTYSHINNTLKLEGSAYDKFVASHDVPQSDLTDKTTLRQFKNIARRRKLARVACEELGIELDKVWLNLRDAKIPSEIVQDSIRKARKKSSRAIGSDIGDDYLASLAPYVDAITVDKRTHEFMTQGAQHDPYFREIVGCFIKVRSYKDLSKALSGIAS